MQHILYEHSGWKFVVHNSLYTVIAPDGSTKGAKFVDANGKPVYQFPALEEIAMESYVKLSGDPKARADWRNILQLKTLASIEELANELKTILSGTRNPEQVQLLAKEISNFNLKMADTWE